MIQHLSRSQAALRDCKLCGDSAQKTKCRTSKEGGRDRERDGEKHEVSQASLADITQRDG